MKTICAMLMMVLAIHTAHSWELSFPGGWGPCPSPPVQEHFDITKYQGVWYEYQRFPTAAEALVTCGQASYILLTNATWANTTVAVNNTGIRTLTIGGRTVYRERTQEEGVATIPDLSVPAKLVVQFDRPFIPSVFTRGQYWVLSTNYTDYSLVYSCIALPFNVAHFDSAWILTRERGVAPDNLQALREELRAGGVNPDNFFTVPQDHCDLPALSLTPSLPSVAHSAKFRINWP